MATLREKVASGPLGRKLATKIIIGTPGTEKPIGPEGKTLKPAQHPAAQTAQERMDATAAAKKKVNDYWAARNKAANAKMSGQ